MTSRPVVANFMAGFRILSGHTIDPKEAYKEPRATSGCRCRGLCLEDEACQSYSWLTRGDIILCRLSMLKNDELHLLPNPKGTVAFNQAQYLIEAPDGFLYYYHSELMNFHDATNLCHSLGTGFEIGMYKTPTEFQVLLDFYTKDSAAQIWVNLTPKSVNGMPASVWADGQPFYETYLGIAGLVSLVVDGGGAEMHRFVNGNSFNDRDVNIKLTVLCQKRKTPSVVVPHM